MSRQLVAALLVASFATAAQAQGPLRRAGQALDNAGKNIRARVENEVARGQITAQERDLLARVESRLMWDKQMVGSALRLTVGAAGAVVLQGSVVDEAAKKRAVDLAQSTLGVTAVVDELAVVKDVKVIQAAPGQVIVAPPRVMTPTPVPPVEETVVTPPQAQVIVKP
jgi:hypothetical protein